MSKNKKNRTDEQVAKLALISAVLVLLTGLINLVDRIIQWIAHP